MADPVALNTGYIYLPKSTADHMTIPDSSVLRTYTNGIDIRVDVAMNDWTPSSTMLFIDKAEGNNANELCFEFGMWSGGKLYCFLSNGTTRYNANGTSVQTSTVTAESVLGLNAALIAHDRAQLRMSVDGDDGSSNRVIKFWWRKDNSLGTDGSDDGWTQLGTTLTHSGTTAPLSSGTHPLAIGGRDWDASYEMEGRVYRVQIYNDTVDGTLVLDANVSAITAGEISGGSFTENANSATVTIVGSSSTAEPDSYDIGIIDYHKYSAFTASTVTLDTDDLNYENNDILVAVIGASPHGDVWSEQTSLGWTKAFTYSDGSTHAQHLFWKRASGTESDPTFESDGGGGRLAAIFFVVRGVSTSNVWDITHNWTSGNHANDDLNTPLPTNQPITTEQANALVVLLGSLYSVDTTWGPSAPTGYLNIEAAYEQELKTYLAQKKVAAPGTETPGAWTHTSGAAGLDSITTTLAFRRQVVAAGGTFAGSSIVSVGELMQT